MRIQYKLLNLLQIVLLVASTTSVAMANSQYIVGTCVPEIQYLCVADVFNNAHLTGCSNSEGLSTITIDTRNEYGLTVLERDSNGLHKDELIIGDLYIGIRTIFIKDARPKYQQVQPFKQYNLYVNENLDGEFSYTSHDLRELLHGSFISSFSFGFCDLKVVRN